MDNQSDCIELWECLKRAELQFLAIGNNEHIWDNTLRGVHYVPVSYTRSIMDYQKCYVTEKSDAFHNFSVILLNDQETIGVWPLSVARNGDEWSLGSIESYVMPPLFVDSLSLKLRKRVIEQCLNALNEMCITIGRPHWQGVEMIRSEGMDAWHSRLLERNASFFVEHELYVDLSLSIDVIKSGIRKSYKSLISKGKQLWNVAIHEQISPEMFAEFREFHAQVAGKVTRSVATWDLQLNAINHKEAFLILLKDPQGRMVGGGLFHYSASEGIYAVGVYDRTLFDQPLGHVIQFVAIDHMKALGLRWYKIGDRPYKHSQPKPSDKELNIAYFKEGFATHTFVKLIITCPLAQ